MALPLIMGLSSLIRVSCFVERFALLVSRIRRRNADTFLRLKEWRSQTAHELIFGSHYADADRTVELDQAFCR